jgi:hypothetical protein
MRIETKIQNKLYIWLKSEIEKKNQFSKRMQKNIKKIKIKIDIKIKINFWLKNEIEKRIALTIEKKNQKNEDQIDKNNIL